MECDTTPDIMRWGYYSKERQYANQSFNRQQKQGEEMKRALAILAIAALALSGCASTMTINQQAVTVGGRTIHYVFAESTNEAGLNFSVADRYDDQGNLLTRDAASNNGIMQSVIPAIISGGATAGGLVGAAAVLRPDTTTITQTGGGATATGGTATSNTSSASHSLSAGYSSSSTFVDAPEPRSRPVPVKNGK